MGLVGGGGIAFLFALADIMGSWSVARHTTNIMARQVKRRLLGATLIALLAFWLISYNLGVAHYRDAMLQPDVTGAGRAAVDAFLANPLRLNRVSSYLFFLLGTMFSLLAIIDGVTWDDWYPGYGKRDRKRVRLQDDCGEIADSLVLEGARLRDQSSEKLLALVRNARNAVASMRAWIGSLSALTAKAEVYVDSWQEIAQTLVSRYQAENERYREVPRPGYFGTSVAPIQVTRHVFRRDHWERLLNLQESQLNRIISMKERVRNEIEDQYREFMVEVSHLREGSH